MRVVHISTGDIGGGAAVAAYRIHRGLCDAGIDSLMLVGKKLTDDYRVISPTSRVSEILSTTRSLLDTIPFRIYARRRDMGWSLGWVANGIHRRIEQLHPDIIHLHFIAGGLVPFSSLRRLRSPIVWTLHDMWAFTGGCHYSGTCSRYQVKCGACPKISSGHEWDLTRLAWKMKSSAVEGRNLTAIGPSVWMAECARNSSVFGKGRVLNIPYGLDLNEFSPVDRPTARALLGLPVHSKLVMFGGMSVLEDERKGFRYLSDALHVVGKQRGMKDLELVVFGSSAPRIQQSLPMKTHYLGRPHDSLTLRLMYSAADLFVAPSVEENLANTVLESLACGTPVVAFDIGGMPDMIRHRENGYLATPFDPRDLAAGIHMLVSAKRGLDKFGKNARKTMVEKFDIRDVTQKYIDLYTRLSSVPASG